MYSQDVFFIAVEIEKLTSTQFHRVGHANNLL